MKMVEKVLGRRLGDWLLKKTVYGQFVAGDNSREVMAAVSKLRAVHVGPLLAAPMEDDVHVGYEWVTVGLYRTAYRMVIYLLISSTAKLLTGWRYVCLYKCQGGGEMRAALVTYA